ncbi:MAG: MFS transporter [Polyangiaceae bacterium]
MSSTPTPSLFRIGMFRALFLATLVSNVGGWMEDVGETWLMTSLGGSPLMVALVQSSASLPVIMLALPAGALADIVDRRRLLLVTQIWMIAVATTLGALTLAKVIGPWGLLSCTFAMGIGSALDGPAWQAVVADVVPRRDVSRATVANEVGFNASRVAGPALGGLVVAWVGSGFTFLLNALSFLGVLVVLLRWKHRREPTPLPTERLLVGVRTGVRYARGATTLPVLFVRTFASLLMASALWALMPSFVSRELHGSSAHYGILLAGLGVGAVAGAAPVSRARERFGVDAVLIPATLLLAFAIGGLAVAPSLLSAALAAAAAGAGWLAILATSTSAVQKASAEWVRARSLAMYILVSEAAMLVGGIGWGWLATRTSIRLALELAAAGTALTVLVAAAFRLRDVDRVDRSPTPFYPIPSAPSGVDVEGTPVLVQVEYRVDASQASAFRSALNAVGRSRRRTGAALWLLTQDSEDSSRFVEWFFLESWNEHHRQHGRWTKHDQELWLHAHSLIAAGSEPKVSHLLQTTEAQSP